MVALIVTIAVTQASFDCGKTSIQVEKWICEDATLSRLDRELDEKYTEVLAVAPEAAKERLRASQKDWFTRRDRSGRDGLRLLYEQRISTLPADLNRAARDALPSKGDTGQGDGELLLRASHDGVVSDAKKALDQGTHPDAINMNGRSPLAIAAIYGHEEVVKLLLDRGANVELEELAGGNALSGAILNGRTKIVELLLAYGARVDVRYSEEMKDLTPIVLAAQAGNVEIIKALIDRGADVNSEVSDRYHTTPLYMALFHENYEAARLLAGRGARLKVYRRADGAYKVQIMELGCRLAREVPKNESLGVLPCDHFDKSKVDASGWWKP